MARPTSTWLRLGSLLLGFALSACVHATPVSPAPLHEAEAPRLRAAIVGTCDVIATRKPDGDKRDADHLSVVFGADGTGKVLAHGIVMPFRYSLEGRNVRMTGGIYEAFRMEEWSGGTLQWFHYDLSEFWYCRKL